MKRIMIIGSSGAGKSTFAKKFGQILDRPIIHLDIHYWQPNWQKVTKDEWRSIQQKLIKEKEWIIEGNYHSTLDLRLAAADTIIFLDYPKWLCLWRALKRRLTYHGKIRQDLGGNNQERTSWIFWWRILTYARPEVLAKLAQLDDEQQVIQLSSPQAADQYLAQLKDART